MRADSAGGTGSNRLRHAASVRSRTIMKNPPSAEAAADAHDSHRRHRAFLPRLTEQHGADRWLDAPDQRLASLNGEENDERADSCAAIGRGARASRRGFLARGSPLALAAVTRVRTEPRDRRSELETPGVAFAQTFETPTYVDHNDRARPRN
ncbi:hypothetical protein ROHU_027517 [Labeo rohita]|uniref:Uncharacterized protein n=1 Tax=Labeo rohita TaxID=84645 RepID=A0A498M6Y6_LABRO|nr:hypothetical protein ROHU_027517 [Labeo rohita]